jgi:hypothetical protein
MKKIVFKKAQSGVKIDKTSVSRAQRKPDAVAEKPSYTFIQSSKKGQSPTKKDSTDYKEGYNIGRKDKQAVLLTGNMNTYMGSTEGSIDSRSKKTSPKRKSGGTIPKKKSGGSMGKCRGGCN